MLVRGMSLAHSFPVALLERPMAFNQDLKGLECFSHVDPEYLLYYLTLHERNILGVITNATHGTCRLSTEDLHALPVLLPPVPEQRSIAAVLSSVEQVIETTGAARTCQDRLAQALTDDLLGGSWESVPCGDLCRVVVGIVLKPASLYVPRGVPCLRSANVRENRLELRELVFISDQSNSDHEKSKLRAGDVVTVRTGYPGTSCVVPASLEGVNCIDLVISRPGPRIRGAFLARYLNSTRGRRAVRDQQHGLAQQHFNVGALQKLAIPVPPVEEQDQIVRHLEHADDLSRATAAKLSSLERLRTGLMQDLLTGQRRVLTTDETSAPAEDEEVSA
jgi:type I restriction enzyme S subunit